ncbi:hypothetical protein L798_06758 [Zootermopsis nevadensis]|uniref:Uncharacterized protein n=1 Tax=Zootermopsis nevadensis TaxID=136037 RepID=A0A067RKA2_ZOONE|nr:hypothetical protein L798_06758 [Zootermopsis nevadensis]
MGCAASDGTDEADPAPALKHYITASDTYFTLHSRDLMIFLMTDFKNLFTFFIS